jgi:hypothetical protein
MGFAPRLGKNRIFGFLPGVADGEAGRRGFAAHFGPDGVPAGSGSADAPLARIAMEERPIDRNQLPAQKIERTRQQHKIPVRSLQRITVVLAESADRAIAGANPFSSQISSTLRPASRSRPRDDRIWFR